MTESAAPSNTTPREPADDIQIRQLLEHWAFATRKGLVDWQPDTNGEGKFELRNLKVVAGNNVAFAHSFIQCGGTLKNGDTFEDLVRATFCLQKTGEVWKVTHQHCSKPFQLPGGK